MDYVGPLPAEEMFAPNCMSAKRYEDFKIWYKGRAETGEPFHYRTELVKYCVQVSFNFLCPDFCRIFPRCYGDL